MSKKKIPTDKEMTLASVQDDILQTATGWYMFSVPSYGGFTASDLRIIADRFDELNEDALKAYEADLPF